jgi:hypothetical protein
MEKRVSFWVRRDQASGVEAALGWDVLSGAQGALAAMVAGLESLLEGESETEASAIHRNDEFFVIGGGALVDVEAGRRAIQTSGASLRRQQVQGIVLIKVGDPKESAEENQHPHFQHTILFINSIIYHHSTIGASKRHFQSDKF